MKKWMACVAVALLVGLVGCAKQPAVDGTAQPVVSQPVQSMDQSAVSQSSMQDQAGVPAALARINFDFDQYTLTPEAKATLEANAMYLKAKSYVNATVEGHCDERGSDEYNLALGEKRALAAKNYLESLGVNGSRLNVISYGEEKPLVMGSTEAAWAQNRRVEFTEK